MELLRVKTLIHVDKWQTWLNKLLKTKLVRYVDGVKETYTEPLYLRPEGDPGGYFVAGFLPDVLRMAKIKGIETKYVDLREFPEHAYDTDPEALNIQLRFKQDVVIDAIVNNDKGIIKCPTGFGKSFIIKCLTVLYPNARFVICTEAASVVQSLYEALSEVHGKAQVGMIKSGTKDSETTKRIQVSTTKSILRSQIRTCDFLLFDEVHNVGKNQITDLLMNNVDHARMFGFTASLWRGDHAEDLIKGLFGEVIAEATYQEAVEHNLVVPIKAIMIPCRAKERPATDSMMLDRKFNYICNHDRNNLIAQVAADIPEDEQVLIMVDTFEHAVRLHQLPQLAGYTVCHGGNGTKVKRNRPWTEDTAPESVLVIQKSNGSVHLMVRVVTAMGTTAFQEAEVTGPPVDPETVGLHDVTVGQVVDGYAIREAISDDQLKAVPFQLKDQVVSLSKLFADYVQADGSPCGAAQSVDRNIGGVDMAQYKMTPKKISAIRRDFESGKLKKLIATNIFSEGVNFVHLKYLIRADGEVSKISNTQIPGRLSRLYPGKTCSYLIDFVDHFSPWAYRRSCVRYEDYKEAGWTILPMPPRDNHV